MRIDGLKTMLCVDIFSRYLDNRQFNHAPVAQLDRVPGYELGGREFESLRARHYYKSSKENPTIPL